MSNPKAVLAHKFFSDDSGALRAASAKAKELDPAAFACRPRDAPASARCQIRLNVERVEKDGVHVTTLLCGSGRTWAEALEMFWNWHQDQLKPGRDA